MPRRRAWSPPVRVGGSRPPAHRVAVDSPGGSHDPDRDGRQDHMSSCRDPAASRTWAWRTVPTRSRPVAWTSARAVRGLHETGMPKAVTTVRGDGMCAGRTRGRGRAPGARIGPGETRTERPRATARRPDRFDSGPGVL